MLLPELTEPEPTGLKDGSARVALQTRPRFDKYIFIEKDEKRSHELERLKFDFPEFADDIVIERREANAYLQELGGKSWEMRRAVLFLDPYGMQVEWPTLGALAETRAIDLWILFPLGVAVSRLLRRDGEIRQSIRNRLDTMFGTTDWFDAFYKIRERDSLFGPETELQKVVDLDGIGYYFVKRLRTISPGVAPNPLRLLNTKNVPLYLLCFAAANEKGAPTAVKIAQDILGG
ncbi:MAG: three-Cys-motif partner protein TcmP [Acidobacteriota bacterium]